MAGITRRGEGDRLDFDTAPAVVVGLCGHGLSVVRALRAGDVPVIAIEANRSLPGARTRLASVRFVEDVNGPGLIDALLEMRGMIKCPGLPVLFLTNDTMVRTVGTGWDRLDGHYRLSWAGSRQHVVTLLEKAALEERCALAGLNYPRTCVLRGPEDVSPAISAIGFPIIVKPSRPLAKFKTALPGTREELEELVARYAADLPFLMQAYIPGDDRSIYFSAVYLEEGRVVARFDGHKLRSRPLGHTTVAEPSPDEPVHAATRKFFAGLALSGPASLELKRDDRDRLWVIEPTIGRTDFWIDVCTANGVNLPLVEYRRQAGQDVPMPVQQNRAVWFNEERDPLSRLWLLAHNEAGLRGRRATYLYFHRGDPVPGLVLGGRILAQGLGAVVRRLSRLVRPRPA